MFIKPCICVLSFRQISMHQKKRKPNVSVGCSHGASLSPDTGVSLQWGGGSHAAAYPIPHPPKQIKCLIQTRPLSAPQPQPLSRPQGTMPTVIRRQHRWSNTDTQVQLLHSLLMDSQSGFNCGIGCVGQLIQIIWVLGNIQIHRHICNAEDKVRVYRNKMRTWESTETKRFLTAVLNYLREVNTQEVSLKQQSVNIMLEHSPWNTGQNGGLKDLSGAPNKPGFQRL